MSKNTWLDWGTCATPGSDSATTDTTMLMACLFRYFGINIFKTLKLRLIDHFDGRTGQHGETPEDMVARRHTSRVRQVYGRVYQPDRVNSTLWARQSPIP